MQHLYFWPALIIALGLGLWTWQWQATRQLSQRAEELSIRLKAVSPDATAPLTRTAPDQSKTQSSDVADKGISLLNSWQEKNAAAFSEMASLNKKRRALRDSAGDEVDTTELDARMSELRTIVEATIESDESARVMLTAFVKRHPTGRDANGEISMVVEVLGYHLLENQPGVLLDLQISDQRAPRVLAALAKVIETDPAHADSWMRADPKRMTNPNLLQLWLGGLAARDTSAALAALDDVAALDPQATLAGITTIASHLQTNEERQRLLTHCAAELDVARRTALVQGVFGKVSSFAESRELFSGLEIPGSAKDQIAAEIASRNLADEPAKRGDWLLEQTTDEGRPQALRVFVTAWTRADYNAAGTWLGKLPVGLARDTAVVEFVGLISNLDPEAAQAWANVVSDPVLRRSVLERMDGQQ